METTNNLQRPNEFVRHLEAAWLSQQEADRVVASEFFAAPVSYDDVTEDGFDDWKFLINRATEVTPNNDSLLPVEEALPARAKRFERVKTAANSISYLFSPVLESESTEFEDLLDGEESVKTVTPEAWSTRVKSVAKSAGSLAIGVVDWVKEHTPERRVSPKTMRNLSRVATAAVVVTLVVGAAHNLIAKNNTLVLKPADPSALIKEPVEPVSDQNIDFQVPRASIPSVTEAAVPGVSLFEIYQKQVAENAAAEQQKAQEQAAAAQAQAEAEAAANAKTQAAAEAARLTTSVSATHVNTGEVKEYTQAQIKQIIRDAADKYGVSENMLLEKASCESTYIPDRINYNYEEPGMGHPEGLFQHLQGYWPERATKYGYDGASIDDPVAQANVTAAMHADGFAYLWEC